MKKVLIIEDMPRFYQVYSEDLDNEVLVLVARDSESALSHLSANPDIAIIVMDACLKSEMPDTIDLTKEIRALGYKGPMIANSNSDKYNKLLMSAGCDLKNSYGSKDCIPEQVLALLKGN